jgi:hypothetical protein
VRKKIEKNFWDMEIIGNRRKKNFRPELRFYRPEKSKKKNAETFYVLLNIVVEFF